MANPDYYSLSLNDLMKSTITGATLTKQNITTVPAAVTVYTQAEISRLGINTLEELMNFVPGFQSIRQGETSIHRGYSSRGRRIGTTGREVLVLFNGMRLDNIWSGGMGFSTPMFDLAAISRVEFIRGPGSAIYGSNAFLGVINIISEITANRINIEFGSHNNKAVKVQGKYTSGDYFISGFINYTQDSGQKYQLINSFINQKQQVKDPRKNSEIGVKFGTEALWLELLHSNKRAQGFFISDSISEQLNENQVKYTNVYLGYKTQFLFDIDTKFRIGYKKWQQSTSAQVTAANALSAISEPSSTEPFFIIASLQDKESWFKFDNNWSLNKFSSVQFGLEYRYQVLLQAKVLNNYDLADLTHGHFPIRYYGNNLQATPLSLSKSQKIFGLYGQYQHRLFEKIDATIGLRFDDYQNVDTSLSPRIGLVYPLTKQHIVKVLYGQAFRAPSNNELNAINNATIVGNPDLKPENVSTWDFIYRYQGDKLNGNFGIFDNKIDDAIVQLVNDNVRSFTNLGTEKIRGVELELAYQFNEKFIIKSGGTHFINKPESAFRESKNLAYLIINYQLSNWQFNLASYYHSEKQRLTSKALSRKKLAAYWLANSKLSYQFSKHCSSSLTIKNVFNRNVVTPPQGSNAPEAIPNRGRSYYLAIEYKM